MHADARHEARVDQAEQVEAGTAGELALAHQERQQARDLTANRGGKRGGDTQVLAGRLTGHGSARRWAWHGMAGFGKAGGVTYLAHGALANLGTG